jgi:hypothetical protein
LFAAAFNRLLQQNLPEADIERSASDERKAPKLVRVCWVEFNVAVFDARSIRPLKLGWLYLTPIRPLATPALLKPF